MAKQKSVRQDPHPPKLDLVKLAVSLCICFAAAAIGSMFTFSEIPNWYASLDKPWFNPPNWVFGPVWTLLYAMMGISLYLIWMKGLQDTRVVQAIAVFIVQLALNALWSYLFFGLHNPLLAFFEIILLWAAIGATLVLAMKVSRLGGLLLIPYLCWVSFAAFLNFTVWDMNP